MYLMIFLAGSSPSSCFIMNVATIARSMMLNGSAFSDRYEALPPRATCALFRLCVDQLPLLCSDAACGFKYLVVMARTFMNGSRDHTVVEARHGELRQAGWPATTSWSSLRGSRGRVCAKLFQGVVGEPLPRWWWRLVVAAVGGGGARRRRVSAGRGTRKAAASRRARLSAPARHCCAAARVRATAVTAWSSLAAIGFLARPLTLPMRHHIEVGSIAMGRDWGSPPTEDADVVQSHCRLHGKPIAMCRKIVIPTKFILIKWTSECEQVTVCWVRISSVHGAQLSITWSTERILL